MYINSYSTPSTLKTVNNIQLEENSELDDEENMLKSHTVPPV